MKGWIDRWMEAREEERKEGRKDGRGREGGRERWKKTEEGGINIHWLIQYHKNEPNYSQRNSN